MPSLRILGASLVLGALVLGAGACGPSIRMRHESSLYFERCHAAELRDDVPTSQRAECWRRWLEWYAEGQEPARLLHARERLVFLYQGQSLDPLPDSASPHVLDEASEPDTVPPPGGGTVPQPHAYVAGTPTPRDHRQSTVCEPLCRGRWDSCAAPCREETRRACLGACQAEYTTCMRGCY